MTAGITLLEHVNLRTTQLDAMVAWYDRVLGLKPGARPPFDSPGAWLYVGEVPAVHLSVVQEQGTGSEVPLRLEHFAFRAGGDPDRFERALIAAGETYRKGQVPATGTVAFNIWDPDGNHIHVDFAAPA